MLPGLQREEEGGKTQEGGAAPSSCECMHSLRGITDGLACSLALMGGWMDGWMAAVARQGGAACAVPCRGSGACCSADRLVDVRPGEGCILRIRTAA